MLNSYTTAMRNYATFSGRMSRSAYWHFVLVYAAIGIAAWAIDHILGTTTPSGGVFMGIVAVAHLIPNLASLARRLHDSDKSALWLLLIPVVVGGIITLIFACLPGTSGPNRFGDQPVEPEADGAVAYRAPTAAAKPASNRNVPQPSDRVDTVAELERLVALRSNGSLSESEYEVMKSRLLARSV